MSIQNDFEQLYQLLMLANEKQFDKNLERIGELYEGGKDLLNGMMIHYPEDLKARDRLFQVLREMRDIAAVSLKANHEIKEN